MTANQMVLDALIWIKNKVDPRFAFHRFWVQVRLACFGLAAVGVVAVLHITLQG